MPRVSDEHLERRRQQILDAAQRCFIRKGFHETSMQDVFAESGLSAGAVYRYFKGKNEIVAALAHRATSEVRIGLAEMVRRDDPPSPAEIFAALGHEIRRQSGADGMIPLAPHAWSLALTNEEMAATLRETIGGMRDLWREYLTRMADAGRLPAGTDIDALAKTLLSMIPGYILQSLLMQDLEPDTLARAVAVLLPMTETAPEPAG